MRHYDVADRDVVYVTSDRMYAQSCAAHWLPGIAEASSPSETGDLYEVEPLGALARDPDYADIPGLSWTCTSARVIAVAQRRVPLAPELEFYGLRHVTWGDGTRMYDAEGFILPNLNMQRIGIEAADLRLLGQYATWEQANAWAAQLTRARAIGRAGANGGDPPAVPSTSRGS